MKKELRSDAFLQDAMERWGDMVYRLALGHTRNIADAEDIYQDVFLRLLRDTTDFQTEEHLKAWLLHVTQNRCCDHARHLQRHSTQELPACIPDSPPDPAAEELWQAVAALPPKQLTVIHLFYEEGRTTEQIASLLHCRPATVRTRLHRARKALKRLLGGDQDEERFERVRQADAPSICAAGTKAARAESSRP
ncbi:RNA polymerase sigma factor [Caproicibacterium argilliputei]|uniref:Sigma-70 family RNA polymerase sigma factor n=1 Tax=Caproicibacterium argilliputei TaxID=3030016 RepID=A0AA97DB72_9FIRM|nr:sigma-70 family RNA polymerase sigma factor [Caproicibacterium argilliputei]WOC32617.1 sigma-70 family RNA polymerase sigma factor [Caproicibacterium argilliputei]